MQILTALVLTVLLSILWFDSVIGEYEVEITVHSYLNPTGRCDECQEDNNTDPGCCDESTIRSIDETCPASESCDTGMITCFAVDSTVELTGVSCQNEILNIAGTQLYRDTNSLDFSLLSTFFGRVNPLVLTSDQAWVGLQTLYVVVECSSNVQGNNCNIMQRIDAIPVDIDITVGTASPETTYIGIAGIAQLNVSFLVRCADGFYGQDCLTSCPDFESCAGCGLSGFTGEFCQFSTEDCSEVYCNGFDQCVDGSSTCDCNPGFTGDLCQHDIDDCEGHNCNDGGCVDEVNSFTCQCNPGFFGEACENTDHCFGITCSGNGQCESLQDTFTCTCETGYTGNQCQVETIVDSAGASIGAITGGVVGALSGVVVLAIIVVMVIIFALSRSRRSEGGNFEGNAIKERDGTISPRDNPAYGAQGHAIDNPSYGAQVSATAHAQDSSVPDREFDNPLYTSNMDTEDPYTVPSESPSPPNVYDRVGPRVLDEEEYYSAVAT